VQLVYDRYEDLKCSDHKPVYSLFNLQAKVLIKEKRDAVHLSLVRQLDQWENEYTIFSALCCMCLLMFFSDV
jgi:hypothetical protein